MTALVIGGAASGKSELAEAILLGTGVSPRVYIATMEPRDGEGRRRVERHRAMRARKGFSTVERYAGLAGLALPGGGAALLECVTTLTAGELFSPGGAGDGAVRAVLEGAERLIAQTEHTVIVTGDVFRDGCRYAGDTARYLGCLAEINRALASRCDAVIEAVCGLPVAVKGELPWA